MSRKRKQPEFKVIVKQSPNATMTLNELIDAELKEFYRDILITKKALKNKE